MTVTSTLMDPSAINNILASAGGIYERRSGLTNEAAQLAYRNKLDEFKMLLPFAFQDATAKGDAAGAGNIATTAAVVAAHDLVEGGTWADAMQALPDGGRKAAELAFRGWNSVGGVQVNPNTGQPNPGQSINYVQSNLVQEFMKDGQLYRLIGGPTREVYTDKEGLPGTGVRSVKGAEPIVGFTAAGNRQREREIRRRTTTKTPYGSESLTVNQ
jgi:hypothetical protein